MKQILLLYLFLSSAKYMRGNEVAEVAAVAAEVHTEISQNPSIHKTLPTKQEDESPTENNVPDDEVKVMIRNINSLLVLDGSDFVVKMAPLIGTATQLWTFKRSAVNPKFIIFRNVANGRTLTSWPYTRHIFSYDWSDSPYTWWKLNRDRRLVSAAYAKDYLTYGYGNMAISLRCDTASDGTDEWILVESKDNKVPGRY